MCTVYRCKLTPMHTTIMFVCFTVRMTICMHACKHAHTARVAHMCVPRSTWFEEAKLARFIQGHPPYAHERRLMIKASGPLTMAAMSPNTRSEFQ